jgi:hypothetical protein
MTKSMVTRLPCGSLTSLTVILQSVSSLGCGECSPHAVTAVGGYAPADYRAGGACQTDSGRSADRLPLPWAFRLGPGSFPTMYAITPLCRSLPLSAALCRSLHSTGLVHRCRVVARAKGAFCPIQRHTDSSDCRLSDRHCGGCLLPQHVQAHGIQPDAAEQYAQVEGSAPHSACPVADFGFVAFAIRAVFRPLQGGKAEIMA